MPNRSFIVVALSVVAPIWCATAHAVQVTLTPEAFPAGGTIQLHLDLAHEEENPTAVVVVLDFDVTRLYAESAQPGEAAGDATVAVHGGATGAVLVAYGVTPIPSGRLATIYLRPGERAGEAGNVLIEDGGSSAADNDAAPLSIAVAPVEVQLGAEALTHTADGDRDGRISMEELLRVVQLFSQGPLFCDDASEDGYSTTNGHRNCPPHDSDFHPQDWRISLSELLRVIQFYNAEDHAYRFVGESEDRFAPGAAAR